MALLHYDYEQVTKYEAREQQSSTEPVTLKGKSLYLFSPRNPLRRFCAAVTSHWIFEGVIIALIVFSTVTLAFEDPLADPNSPMVHYLSTIDIVMTSIFVLEAALKIVTHGFLINQSGSYMRSGFNVLDFLIIVSAIISYSSSADISVFKVLRTARILRPLRLI